MRALEGLRLLDLTHIVSGPYASMILADLGTETIKIEPPGHGEATRRLLANDPDNSWQGMGAYFLALNRNKKSVALDLKQAEGLALFYELVKTADIVLDNFSSGVTGRLKIDYPRLAAINPRIITCSISGFGNDGPDADRPAYDIVAQALGGTMSLTGEADGPPSRIGVPIGDQAAGMMAAIGILSAVLARAQTGQGQHVDIAMLDTQISLLTYMATMHFLSGQVPQRTGSAHFVHVPYDIFRCRDGYLILAVVTDQFWANLMAALPLRELDTEENRVLAGRWQNRALITERLNAHFSTEDRQHWLALLTAARVPAAPVQDMGEVLADAQVLHRNMVVEVPHPAGGAVKMPGNPIKLSQTGEEQFECAPALGEHTAELLRALGKSDAEIARLAATGVIG